MTGIQREEHPLALLDALYARILSNVPDKVVIHTRKLVLALASSWDLVLNGVEKGTFVDLCNWLAMTPDDAYAAVNQLQSLLRTPKRDLRRTVSEEVFDESRRDEFLRCGILKQMALQAGPGIPKTGYYFVLRFRRPARAVAPDVSTVLDAVKLLFHRRARTVTSLSDPWNSSCKHKRKGEWEEGKDQDWKTDFYYNICNFCYPRLERQFKSLKTHSPDHTVTVLFTYAGDCCVELQFVDPDDGISEWTYWFWIELSLEERKKYGSTV